jgi:uncharacterized ferritin-like protein (DUF455 family)
MTTLYDLAYACIMEADATAKPARTRNAVTEWSNDYLSLDGPADARPVPLPGLPSNLRLVPPRQLARRKLGSRQGHAALIHAIVHIEFNAINLAWDAVYRFRGLPRQYYEDWVQVAREEASHYEMLRRHLNRLGFDYGDFPAHNGLWEMAAKTQHDPVARMAMVPRVLEARGLDVTPGIMKRLASLGDRMGVEILELVLRDEIGHVAIGSRWFQYLCRMRDLDPRATYRELVSQYLKGGIKGPLNHSARLQAGFSEAELRELEGEAEAVTA